MAQRRKRGSGARHIWKQGKISATEYVEHVVASLRRTRRERQRIARQAARLTASLSGKEAAWTKKERRRAKKVAAALRFTGSKTELYARFCPGVRYER